jgi:hypothetical protein
MNMHRSIGLSSRLRGLRAPAALLAAAFGVNAACAAQPALPGLDG